MKKIEIYPPHAAPDSGYLVFRQKTYFGYTLMRPIVQDKEKETLKKAIDLVKQVKVYPFAEADKPKPTHHLDLTGKDIDDKDGNWLDGGKHYKLTMPADVPVKQFWALTAYDMKTAAFIREMPSAGVSSIDKGLEVN